MNSQIKELPRIFLHTGDCFVGVRPTLVTTVLGSCVAVTMFAPKRAISAICHAFLPDSAETSRHGKDPQPCRYVNDAVENMLSTMHKLRVDIGELEVKIMGGASGIGSALSRGGGRLNVAGRNVAMAERVLAQHGVRVKDTHVGGNCGRKLHLVTHTGEIWIKTLNQLPSARSAESSVRR